MVHLSVVFITRKYLYQGNFHPVSQIKKKQFTQSLTTCTVNIQRKRQEGFRQLTKPSFVD